MHISIAKKEGLPVYYSAGKGSPNQSSRNRSGFFTPPRKKPGSSFIRQITLVCMTLLLMAMVYMQLRYVKADHMDDWVERPVSNTAEGTQQTATAADPSAAAVMASYPAPQLQHLVLVAGHAVYTGVDYALATKESSWFLEEYQKIPGQAQTFLDHIRIGIETAAVDHNALLLFSGGQTRQAAGPRSEGLSYWMVAEAAGWFGHPEVRSRAFTEEHARDSFENVLFSLCRFFELTGHYPAQMTAVSYLLKQQRFEQLHRAAVKFPASHFHFIGTPVPEGATGAAAGEAATVAAFQKDPYGCSGALLAKKSRRDPFAVAAPHPSRCPAMADLIKFCSHKLFPGTVPWSNESDQESATGLLQQGRKSSRSGIYT